MLRSLPLMSTLFQFIPFAFSSQLCLSRPGSRILEAEAVASGSQHSFDLVGRHAGQLLKGSYTGASQYLCDLWSDTFDAFEVVRRDYLFGSFWRGSVFFVVRK